MHARTPEPPPALAQRPNRAPTVPKPGSEHTPNAARTCVVCATAPQVKLVVRRVASALEAGAAHPAEERQLAALSQQQQQLSPAELGLAPRADIGAPHLEAGGPSAAGGTGGTAVAALPQRAILHELLAAYNVPRYFLEARYIGRDLGKSGEMRMVQRAGRAEWWGDVTAWPDTCSLQKSKCD